MKIYLDMDGVLADFSSHRTKVYGGKYSHGDDEVKKKEFWLDVWKNHPRWFLDLPVMPDARELFWVCLDLAGQENTAVLTAVNRHNKLETARQKVSWIDYHFGRNITVIPCRRKHKKDWANVDSVLVDDSEENVHEWVGKGGIGILHKSAEETIKRLRELLS